MSELAKQHARLCMISLLCSAVSSLSLLGAALVNSDGKYTAVLILCAILFWLGLAAEQVCIWKANKLRRQMQQEKEATRFRRCGLLTVASSGEGLAADALFVCALLAFLICVIVGAGTSLVQYILISLIVFSFRLHCILNGKNYRYKKMLVRRGRI